MQEDCPRDPGPASRTDRAIKISTAGAVFAVAGVAAYISYEHAYTVVRDYGATGVTARLEPATIDGLVYACSMVMLHAARHQRPVPALARWLMALGIAATLAANMAVGWSHGPVGAVVAAWPAASLVGSYELLVWIIRISTDAVQEADQFERGADHDVPADQVAPGTRAAEDETDAEAVRDARSGRTGIVPADHQAETARTSSGQAAADWAVLSGDALNSAAADAYRESVRGGHPLSERELARKFGQTSRRWARNRMAQALTAREAEAA